MAHQESVQLLHGLPLFENLEQATINKIIVALRSSFLPPDEVVFHAGEVARQLYIIQKGVVAVRTFIPSPCILQIFSHVIFPRLFGVFARPSSKLKNIKQERG